LDRLPEHLRTDGVIYDVEFGDNLIKTSVTGRSIDLSKLLEADSILSAVGNSAAMRAFAQMRSPEFYTFFYLFFTHKEQIICEYEQLLQKLKDSGDNLQDLMVQKAISSNPEFAQLNEMYNTIRNVHELTIQQLPSMDDFLSQIVRERILQLYGSDFLPTYLEILSADYAARHIDNIVDDASCRSQDRLWQWVKQTSRWLMRK
jgi:hypothetical protein